LITLDYKVVRFSFLRSLESSHTAALSDEQRVSALERIGLRSASARRGLRQTTTKTPTGKVTGKSLEAVSADVIENTSSSDIIDGQSSLMLNVNEVA
jgi:hypothetical protein